MFFKKKKQYDENVVKRYYRWKSLDVTEKFVKSVTEFESNFCVDKMTLITNETKALQHAKSIALSLIKLIPKKKEQHTPGDVKEILLEAYDYMVESHEIAFKTHRQALEKLLNEDIR